ncbi:MAG: thioesterase family protein, partial [Alphaproteobacteria bacterium]
MHIFDEDTQVERAGAGSWSARISDRWGIGLVPNGGYVMSVAMAAMRAELGDLEPLTVTSHFMRPASVGPARVVVEVVKTGRRFSTVAARLEQEAGEVIRLLGTCGRIERDAKPVYGAGAPPSLPPRDSLAPSWSGSNETPTPREGEMRMTIRERFDLRLDPATSGFLRGERGGAAELR